MTFFWTRQCTFEWAYISKMSEFVNNVPLKCLNMTLWKCRGWVWNCTHNSRHVYLLFRGCWCWSWRPAYGCWCGSSSMLLLGVWCFLDWFMCLTEARQRSSSARLKKILDTTKLSPKNSYVMIMSFLRRQILVFCTWIHLSVKSLKCRCRMFLSYSCTPNR